MLVIQILEIKSPLRVAPVKEMTSAPHETQILPELGVTQQLQAACHVLLLLLLFFFYYILFLAFSFLIQFGSKTVYQLKLQFISAVIFKTLQIT